MTTGSAEADGWTWDTAALGAGPAPPGVPGLTLGELLGEGGTARVYRAVDAAGRAVAVKVMPLTDLTPREHARFQREAELLARLRHPGVVTVHAWGQTEEVCYLVCELVEGRHLDRAAAELPLEARVALIEAAARAVGAAHALGIVHRDLKPSNVLVDGDGRVKVIDFGAATGVDVGRLTRTGQFVGTPLYAPPERLTGAAEQDLPAGDVWALGAIAFEVLAGTPAYPAEAPEDLLRRGSRPPPSPRAREPRLPRAVAREVVRALDPRPAARHPDAGALADALAKARSAGDRPPRAALLAGLALAAAAPLLVLGRPAPDPPPTPPPPPPPVVEPAVDDVAAPESELPPPPPLEPWSAQVAAPRWAAVRDELRGREDLSAELRRLRGAAALFDDDLEAARADLAPHDPLLALEVARAALVAALIADDVPRALDALGAALGVAAGLEPDPAGQEGRRRAQLDACEALVWLGSSARVRAAPPERVAALAAGAADLLDGPGRPGLEVAAAWVDFGRAQLRGPTTPGPWLAARQPPLPAPGPWQEALPPRLALVAGCLLLVGQADVPGFRPEAAALAPLRQLHAPGVHLHRATLRTLVRLGRDEACAAFRQGDLAAGEARLARALEHQRALDRVVVDPRTTPADLGVRVTLLLMAGDLDAARRWTERFEAPAVRRLFEHQRCLIAGDLEGARGLQRWRPEQYVNVARRMDLHRRVLAGEISVATALSLIPPDDDAQRGDRFDLEWHSAAGLRDVLQGGWWPGRASRAGPQRRP